MFKEPSFTYKLGPKHKPAACLVLEETAIGSNSAGQTGCAAQRETACRPPRWSLPKGVSRVILSLHDFCLIDRLKNSHSGSCPPGTVWNRHSKQDWTEWGHVPKEGTAHLLTYMPLTEGPVYGHYCFWHGPGFRISSGYPAFWVSKMNQNNILMVIIPHKVCLEFFSISSD